MDKRVNEEKSKLEKAKNSLAELSANSNFVLGDQNEEKTAILNKITALKQEISTAESEFESKRGGASESMKVVIDLEEKAASFKR